MINFLWPLVFACLPLPLLVRYLAPKVQRKSATLRVPHLDDFDSIVNTSSLEGSEIKRWPLWLAILCWCLLVTAATRPQWLGDPIELPINGRNIMLAIDLSGSMDIEDFEVNGSMVNRLEVTKKIAGDFIERRQGDKIGLILFGRQAYLQTPLTFDRKTIQSLLNEAVIGIAGKETAIGDAIGLATKRLETTTNQQVLVLLTDGANTAGVIKPIKAAELAAGKGLKIYTIGVGAKEMIVSSLFGSQKINPSADLDEETLKKIASLTNGKFFRAHNTEELKDIYSLIDDLEPVAEDARVFRPTQPLYYWFLAAFMILSTLLFWGTFFNKQIAKPHHA